MPFMGRRVGGVSDCQDDMDRVPGVASSGDPLFVVRLNAPRVTSDRSGKKGTCPFMPIEGNLGSLDYGSGILEVRSIGRSHYPRLSDSSQLILKGT